MISDKFRVRNGWRKLSLWYQEHVLVGENMEQAKKAGLGLKSGAYGILKA